MTKSGSFFSYGSERLGQGRNNAKGFLDAHQEIAKEIEAKVYAALGIGQDLVAPIERDDDPAGVAVASAADGRRRRLAGARCACSTLGTSPIATSAAATARRRSCAHLAGKDVAAASIDAAVAALARRATSTTPATRTFAEDRRGSTAGAPSESSASCSPPASTASSPRRSARRTAGELGAAVELLRRRLSRRPRRATASARSRCSCARATSSSSRTTRCAFERATRP